MRRRPDHRSPDGGYILVAVLSVMLLLTGLTAAGSILVRSALHSARLGDDDTAAAGLTQGGLEIAAYELFVLKLPPAAVDGRRVHLAGATLTPSVVDEAGKVDLNGSDPKLLQSVFVSVGMESGAAAELVARIVAMRGDTAQSQATAQPQTAAQPQPLAQPGTAPTPPTQKPRGFQSIDQLRDVGEISRADLDALKPLMTVFNPDGKVNILTASEDVLRALPDVSGAKVADILAHREDADKAEAGNLQSMLGDAAAMTKIEPGPAYTVRITADTPQRRRVIEAVVAASTSPSDPFYILDWRE